MRGSPSPGSDRDRSAKSGAAARAAVSPLFCGHRRDRPAAGRCPALACRDKCPQLKDRIADLFCSAKVNCGQGGGAAHFLVRDELSAVGGAAGSKQSQACNDMSWTFVD